MPVVVGGLLTLVETVAAALGTAIRDVVQRRNKEKKRRADKFEEMVASVYEFDHWLDRLKDTTSRVDTHRWVNSCSAMFGEPLFRRRWPSISASSDVLGRRPIL